MKKSDLKSGMVVEVSFNDLNKVKYLIIDGKGFSNRGCLILDNYNEDLCHKKNGECKIIKIYKINKLLSKLDDLFNNNNLVVVWERKRIIDWTKVPKWTKVQVRDEDFQEWKNRYFFKFNNEDGMIFPYRVTHLSEFIDPKCIGHCLYKQCRLHESVKPKEEWYKKN